MINDILQLLGVANPQLSSHWSNGSPQNLTTFGSFFLNCNATDNFVAPFNGYLTKGSELERMVMPGGGMPSFGTSFLIRSDPQVYLRIARLYATIIEGKQAHTHLPERPVPYYFLYTNVAGKPNGNSNDKGPSEGLVLAGDDLLCSGDMSIHDQYGRLIDPLAVAAAFDAFMAKFATMETKLLTSPSMPAPATPNSQLKQLAGPANAATVTTIHLCSPNGDAVADGDTLFSNVTAIDAANGLYKIDATGTAITKKGATNAFCKIGAATNGQLADTYKAGAAVAAVKRDFLRAYVVQLDKYLLGNVPQNEPSVLYKTGPIVRDGEQITLLADGTECLGAVGAIMAPGAMPVLLVSPVIDGDFVLPQMSNGSVPRWPAAPVGGAGSTTIIPANLKATFALSAAFIKDSLTVNSDVAVFLTSPQLVAGDWVRIYNRVFHDDGTETRGDGAGAMIDANHTAAFRLSDPFALITAQGQASTLTNPTLMLDVVVVNRGNKKRTFSNVQCTVNTAALLPVGLPQPTNAMLAVAELGTSPAGISGTTYAPQNAVGGNAGNFLSNMTGEGHPREAPRYPTMARYDSIATSYNGAQKAWQSFCGGTIFKKDALSSFPFLGNPGNPGGREYSSVGVYTTGGLLAYDLARAAYRRTRNIGERIVKLGIDPDATTWQPPAANAGANATWAAATLQTIAAHCETPELGLQFSDMSSVPATFSDFVKLVENKVGGLPSWLPNAVKTKLQAAIDSQGNDAKKQQGYAELYQEIVTSINGRRDTYWALKQAISSARECIYIQGSLLDNTAYAADKPGMDDLLQTLVSQLQAYPRLKLILCFSTQIRYGKGYEAFEARDYGKRKDIVELLQGPLNAVSNTRERANQVIAFHPHGFPMRLKELRHQLVLVDDMWALIGSSSFRRRGLLFDGAQDIVALDKTIVNGKSAGIRAFRQKLLQEHLNLQTSAGITPGLQVRLRDLRESFYALKELLDSGGAGLISPLWEGDRQMITPAADDLANPGASFSGTDALLTAVLAGSMAP